MMKAVINRIPSGMHRSVENAAIRAQQHPVKDASLTGCGVIRGASPSTGRYSLTGMMQCAIINQKSLIINLKSF